MIESKDKKFSWPVELIGNTAVIAGGVFFNIYVTVPAVQSMWRMLVKGTFVPSPDPIIFVIIASAIISAILKYNFRKDEDTSFIHSLVSLIFWMSLIGITWVLAYAYSFYI